MARGSDGTWRAQVASVPGKTLYAFRAWGPNWTFSSSWTPGSSAGFASDVDASGNRYNPNKVLADPYARELSHDKTSPAPRRHLPRGAAPQLRPRAVGAQVGRARQHDEHRHPAGDRRARLGGVRGPRPRPDRARLGDEPDRAAHRD